MIYLCESYLAENHFKSPKNINNYLSSMKNLNFLKLFFGIMLMMVSATFVGCVDDNDDTEAPYLEVSPTTLEFTSNGVAAEGSQSYFEISTNRAWTAQVLGDKSWVTLSAIQGDGNTKVNVSIPAGINDEATIEITISNKVGPLKKELVTIISGQVVEKETIYYTNIGDEAVSSPFPYVDAYTGWDASGTGASTVTYSGQKATVRASGLSNNGAYNGASGPNIVFFGTLPADFQINQIGLSAEQTNLQLTFGASSSIKAEDSNDYNNTFDISKFEVSLSADGTSWTPLTYTINNGDQESPYWIFATADFTLTEAVSSIYVKFTALVASAIRLDDITLQTGNGGQSITLSGGVTPPNPGEGETAAITIPELISSMSSTSANVDATADRYFEAIVLNDTVAMNYANNQLIVSTEGATTGNNGIKIYGSQVNPRTIKVGMGDKIKVTLKKGLANKVIYNGLYELTGAATEDWVDVEVISRASVTTTPIVIQASELNNYQSMVVTINNATPAEAGVWGSTTTHTFSANGTNFAVFCSTGASFANDTYSVATGNITGIATVYKSAAQLVPRNLNDVVAFNTTAPTITGFSPSILNFASTGGTQSVTITCANQGNNTLSVSGLSGILSATVDGNTISVTAGENTTAEAVTQIMTVSLENGNSITVDVIVSAASSGDQTIIALNLTDATVYPDDFPKLSANKLIDAQAFTFGGYEYTFAGTATYGYYQALASGVPYIINGRSGAYIELPAISGKRLSKVTVTTRSGASTSVQVGIYDANNTAVAGGDLTTWSQADGNLEYTYSLPSTTNDTKYRIYIGSNHNAQFTNWELTYE